MYVVAHPGSLFVLATEAEAVTRAKCFVNDSGKLIGIYKLVLVRTIEPAPEPTLAPVPRFA